MNNKTFWIGFVVVFVLMQAIGFVVHEVWLAETYAGLANVFRGEADMMGMMWMMMVASVGSLFLFCYIFTKGYEGKGIAEGARYGLWMGLFMSLPMAIDQYVVYPLPSNLAVSWFVTGVISFVIAGAVFAAIYKPSRN
ncbi:MAG TPA: hypothetical protein VGA68_07910 [Woeseiaceae bacterium]|jgi:hypothetical protein